MVNLKGEYNRGLVKRTKQQMKKHRIQMTNEELSFLEHHLKQINQLNYSYHVLNKQISFDKADIENMLKHENLKSFIVEYNETPTKDGMDRRVLLRGMLEMFCIPKRMAKHLTPYQIFVLLFP